MLLEESVCYDQLVLLAKLCQLLPCFILYSKAKFTRYLLTSYLCIPVPYDEKDIILGVFQKILEVFLEPFIFSFLWITGWGIDLDYSDIEWFPLETNRGLSVIFEIAPTSAFFVDDEGYSISSKGILPMGSLSLLQRIFPTQELNWDLLHCRQDFLPTELLGKPQNS